MRHLSKIDISAECMRSDSGDALLFHLRDLPADARVPGAPRDRLFTNLAQQERSANVVILSATMRPCHDVECVLGQIAGDGRSITWNGDCVGLASSLAMSALTRGYIHRERIPQNGTVAVRIWQSQVRRTIIVHAPVVGKAVPLADETAAAVRLDVLDPAAPDGEIFPTGRVTDHFDIPGVGVLEATLVNVGEPTVFINIADIRLAAVRVAGVELARAIRATVTERTAIHAPVLRIVYVATPQDYVAADGTWVAAENVDLCAWDAMPKIAPGASSLVALGVAATIPETVVNRAVAGHSSRTVRVGYPEGISIVTASTRQIDGEWIVTKVVMSDRCRVLSEGSLRLPA